MNTLKLLNIISALRIFWRLKEYKEDKGGRMKEGRKELETAATVATDKTLNFITNRH